MSGSPLFCCMDGTIRDLAALHGTYRIIPETAASVRMLFDILQLYEVDQIHILLDAPVSNSGRLKVLIADLGAGISFSLDIQVRKDVDQELYGKENVVSSDSVILDRCASWVNLTWECMRQRNVEGIRVW